MMSCKRRLKRPLFRQTPMALAFLGMCLVLHFVGLIDDEKP